MFFFLRHAQTDYNVQGRIADREDIPLNEAGILEASFLRATNPIGTLCITRAVLSPLPRCKETFDIIKGSNDIPVSFDDRLRERHFGSYAGLLKKDVPLDNIQHVVESEELGVEGFESITNRTVSAVMDAIKQYPNDTLLFVSHGANFTGLMLGLVKTQGTMAKQTEPYQFSKNQNGVWECTLAFDTLNIAPRNSASHSPAP